MEKKERAEAAARLEKRSSSSSSSSSSREIGFLRVASPWTISLGKSFPTPKQGELLAREGVTEAAIDFKHVAVGSTNSCRFAAQML